MFGALCLGAAIQFYFTFPETCGKTLEEIEVLFSPQGPHAWQTRKGDTRLHDEMNAVSKGHVSDGAGAAAREDIEKVIKHDKGEHREHKPTEEV